MGEIKQEIKISVRNLVESVLRSGDLDNRFVGSARALEGTRIHKKIQKSAGEYYSSEYFLKYSIEYQKFLLIIEGRADGIIKTDEKVIIDEIKTTTAPLDMIDEDYNILHWAQAKCYAYIYAAQEGLNSIDVRLTYYNLETEDIKYILKTFDTSKLREFFHDMLDKYFEFANASYDWNIIRDYSIKRLDFPFEKYRAGQRELAVSVYRTVKNGYRLFVQAPTGIGKTISTIFPAVKAMGEGHISKIFYLTAKTITRSVAEEAFDLMAGKGLKFKVLTLTAKEKICFNEKVNCNPEKCEYAKGHYDRVNNAILDILKNEDHFSREIIEQYARKYNVCPFEYSLDLSLWADAVICDYNYVFDPNVYLRRFFMDNGGDYAFLIDEAHNLVDRAREMFSAELYMSSFVSLSRITEAKTPAISKKLTKISKFMLDMKEMCDNRGSYVSKDQIEGIYPLLTSFLTQAEQYLTSKHMDLDEDESEEMLALYFDIFTFMKIWDFYDERYVTYIESIGDDVKIKMFCIDPSYLLHEALKRGKCAVFFSATLLPIDYYREMLGGSEDDYSMYLPSPFNIDNRRIFIADNISTRYKDRENTAYSIAKYIKSAAEGKKGNYLVFFPSYKYMNAVYDIFQSRYGHINTFVQTPGMSEQEREDFLALFKSDPENTTLGFCVLGGLYSEGIDLKNDRLIGVIVVSVGLPKICLEREIIKSFFAVQKNKGYEYAYMYPGMNKVLQAAGRLIRTESDKGIILLIDDRFGRIAYQRLFPREWFPNIRINNNNIDKFTSDFWAHHR